MDQSDAFSRLIDVIRRRRSVRQFEPGRRISREVLLQVAEAARWAPTGANSQCFDVMVIDDPRSASRCSMCSWHSPIG